MCDGPQVRLWAGRPHYKQNDISCAIYLLRISSICFNFIILLHNFCFIRRYCIDNGAMIAQAGIFALQHGITTKMKDATCTQRFRTDQVKVIWRPSTVWNHS